MASGSEDEIEGAWYFGSSQYDPQSSSESEEPYIVEYKNCGRMRVVVPPNVLESRPMGEHTCIRDVASCLDLAPSTVWRLIKKSEIKAHSNPLHPALTDANKLRRVKWILSLIQEDSIQRHPIYKGMLDFIHIDEKWFYLTKKTKRVYLAHKEKIPYRAAKSSKVAAVRDSKNRLRGSIEIKPTESVTQEVYRSMLIQNLIPTILRKWPKEGPSIIFIQQDNVKVHITNEDPIRQQHNKQGGLTFILTQQPPNSPDCNILDLKFFRSIQSLMHKKMPKSMTELINAVEDAMLNFIQRH
ncbi:uncharacterized protein LOC130798185 [Amaranthus tricolor]|uniref:uncharacterized protein LOC130798185 n=1 Tax=Amaranthus tricolor TaxID=29722 RepID=UPI0025893ED9|nr:uncharacterized protein LOC130798185 [Amaranthus tricolor]